MNSRQCYASFSVYIHPLPSEGPAVSRRCRGVGEAFYPLAAGTGTRLGAGVLSIQATTA